MNKKFIDELHIFLEKNNAKTHETTKTPSVEIEIVFSFNEGDEKLEFILMRTVNGKEYYYTIIPWGDNKIRSFIDYKTNDKKQLSWFVKKFETWLKEESNEKLRIEVKKSIINCNLELLQFFPEEERKKRLLNSPIDYLDLSVRPYNCLKKEGVMKIKDILTYTKMDIRCIHQMGENSALQIFEKMKSLGFELKEG